MEITNSERVIWAEAALSAWRAEKGEHEPDEADARDLISDLLHLLASEGQDAGAELRMAQGNFEVEMREPPL